MAFARGRETPKVQYTPSRKNRLKKASMATNLVACLLQVIPPTKSRARPLYAIYELKAYISKSQTVTPLRIYVARLHDGTRQFGQCYQETRIHISYTRARLEFKKSYSALRFVLKYNCIHVRLSNILKKTAAPSIPLK